MNTDRWQRIEELFLAAVELQPDEQQRFLLCLDDAELRREVASLLACDAKQGAGIQRAVESEAAAVLEGPALTGQRLGAYRALREIGRGGIGAVYLAKRDDDQFHKEVAIKVVKRGMDTEEVLRLFRAERQILANLGHPYIAHLLDGGSTPDGRPFLVMEYVPGKPANVYCREHDLSIAARCRLFLRVCEAVAHAHRNLVVHRDLKPANILVTENGTPKLLDFGVAKILDPGGREGLTQLAPQRRMLTPQYASPEQIRGRAITTASDVYSLGLVLAELLTGVAPENSHHRMSECRLPSETARKSGNKALRRQLAGDLDRIVAKAAHAEAGQRYGSVDELANDVRAYLESRPVQARGDSFRYLAGKFVRRWRYALAAGAAVLLSLVGGIMVATYQTQQARAAQRSAEGRLAQIVTLSNRLLTDAYARLERMPGALPVRKEIAGETVTFLEQLSREAGEDPRVRVALARAYLKLGNLQGDTDAANLGDSEGALKSYRAGANLLTSRQDPEQMALWANLQSQAGRVMTMSGDPAGAAAELRDAIAVAGAVRRSSRDLSLERARLQLSLSRALENNDLQGSVEAARKSAEEIQVLLASNSSDTEVQLLFSTVHTQLGYVYLQSGNPAASERPYAESMRIREQLAIQHPNDILYRRYQWLAYQHFAALQGTPVRKNLGHPDLARLYYEKAKALQEQDLRDPENRSAKFEHAYLRMGIAILDVPKDGLAASAAELQGVLAELAPLESSMRAAERYQRALLITYEYLGNRMLALGRRTEAIEAYRKALAWGLPLRTAVSRDEVIRTQVAATEEALRRATGTPGGPS